MNHYGKILILGLAALAAGCAGLGKSANHVELSAGAPSVEEVLRDLAKNDESIRSFRAGGTFDIESPDFDKIKRFSGSIRFRRPADLYVQGNQRLTGIPIFKLACVGSEFIMEFPGSEDQSFYQVEGEQFEDVPFSVSPSDIAREMFLSESWGTLKRKEVRLISYDPTAQTAQLAVGDPKSPRRIVELGRVNGEKPTWVANKNSRLDEKGEVLAVTTLNNYTNVDGALFPTFVDALFPTEKTRMTFKMRNVQLNTEVPDKYFKIRERARELNLTERHAQGNAPASKTKPPTHDRNGSS